MTLDCPQCDHEHDMGKYPDHIALARNNHFDFVCEECGATFDVDVEWDPVFIVNESTVKSMTDRVG